MRITRGGIPMKERDIRANPLQAGSNLLARVFAKK